MATAYYPDIKWYYYDGDSWEDISGYVLTKSGVSGSWGMRSNKYTDRLAATGEMRMLLDNSSGVFDPDDDDCLTGWAINTPVKMVVTYDGVDYIRFRGTVSTLKFSDPSTYEHTAQALVVDWMNYAYKKTLGEKSIETYKSGGELASEIITAVGQTPQATNLAEGDYEFPAAFDSVTTTTKAATELNKIVLSENGYFYNRHDKVNGETLVFEAESTRNGLRTVSKLPKLVADCGLWELEANTDLVLMEDGTSFVTLDEVQDAHINGTAQAYQRTHGENILNRVTVTAYPKRVDTSEQTIYSLGTPQMLAPGETKTVNVKYQNVTTKESCNAITELCSQPVATTDYLMNRNKAGTSTNITANLTVSVVFHTASADVTLTNSSAYTGYVTRLYLKGYGVYQDASIKAEASDSTSITAYGDHELNIEQQYQRDAVMGDRLAAKILAMEKDPRTKLEKVTLIANTSSVHMLAFLAVDIGDTVKITESDLNLDHYYCVNGIEFSVAEGDVITFSWVLSEAKYLNDLTEVAIEISSTTNSYIEYYASDTMTSSDKITILLSCYFNSIDIDSVKYILTKYFYNAYSVSGFRLFTTSAKIGFSVNYELSKETSYAKDAVEAETWYRFAITCDKSVHYPIQQSYIYYNGIENRGTYSFSGSEYSVLDTGNKLRIGSHPEFEFDSADAVVKIVRIYNRILSSDEIAADAASPGCITNGLIWGGLSCFVDDTTEYFNTGLSESQILFENNNFNIGIPKNSPICREIT